MSIGVKPTLKQTYNAREWLRLLESDALDKEKENYLRFAAIVLQGILGYSIQEDIHFEEGNVDFSFRNSSNQGGVCIEVKGTSTKDLFSEQNRLKPEHRTPITQTWDYMGSRNFDYGIATNYRDFVLIDRSKGYSRYYLFDFMSIKNDERKLKEFLAVFSKQSILDSGFISRLYHESAIEERVFTGEFYKLYHETRLMLLREFQENGQATTTECLHYAQLYLNRLIFVFFAQGTGKLQRRLFAEAILESLNPALVSEYSRYASDTILNLFDRLDKGSKTPIEIFGFNGGLFSDRIPPEIFFRDMRAAAFFSDILLHSALKKVIALDEISSSVVNKFKNRLNPIIANLLLLSSFDFQSEVNVNILGHIFEQSLTDLEELQESAKVSKRKKEGIFYTPEFVTEYICRNSIIPYLSKKGVTTVDDLIEEFAGNIDELEKRFQSVKILDPACGSGAFLLKAVGILLEIHKRIRIVKESKGKYITTVTKNKKRGPAEYFTLEKWNEEEEARRIIENNIFGVDINEESVEITKLSLFLKIASRDRKLIDLSSNIRVGNSLIEDKTIDPKAFQWHEEFKSIFGSGGFDIILGNPPYVRSKQTVLLKPYFERTYGSFAGDADLYVYFIERGLSLLKQGGLYSIIVSSKFTKAKYGFKLRQHLLQYDIRTFIDFGDLRVFEDASTYPCIITVRKSASSSGIEAYKVASLDFSSLAEYVRDKGVLVEYSSLDSEGWTFEAKGTKDLLSKIRNSGKPLGSIVRTDQFYRGITTGFNEAFVISGDQRKSLIERDRRSAEIIFPYLSGKEIKRYRIEWAGDYIIFARRGIDISSYPAIMEYLTKFKKQLTPMKQSSDDVGRKPGNYEWYEIQDSTDYWKTFLEEGIIFPHFNEYSNFTLTPGGFFPNNKAYVIASKDMFLLGVLNSKLMNFFLKSICPFVRGEYYEYMPQYVEKCPVTENRAHAEEISNAVGRIFEANKELQKIEGQVMNRMKENLGVDITRRLSQFYEISFDEFTKEIGKQRRHLSLAEQDEWENYLKSHSAKINSLLDDIRMKDEEIDNLVFLSYGLQDSEKLLVENDLRKTPK
ncbi:MAG: TaqI-like C-terminal specificity domain-containing protein [Thermoplasmata archaeon]